MNEDQIIDNLEGAQSGFIVNEMARNYLYKTSNWALFMAVVGFIFLVISLFSIIVMIFTSSALSNEPGMEAFASVMPIFYVIYIVLIGIFAVPIFRLYQFASKGKLAARDKSSSYFESAMKGLHGAFKWYGIMIILIILLYVIMFAVMGAMVGSAGNDFQF